MEIKMIGFVNLLLGQEPRTQRGSDHQRLAQKRRILNEDRSEDHGEENQIDESIEAPLLLRFGQRLADARGGFEKIAPVHEIKNREQKAHAHHPHGPAVFGHPPERDALEITEEERRVADGRETAADVRHDEDEEDDVMRRDAVFVQTQPRANEQHGGAGGTEDIGQHRADEEEEHVDLRRGLALHIDVDATGHDVERSDKRNEAKVVHGGVSDGGTGRRRQAEEIVAQRDRREGEGDLGVMFSPPSRKAQRPERDEREQQGERGDGPDSRFVRHEAKLGRDETGSII